jgi:hypothetical protein
MACDYFASMITLLHQSGQWLLARPTPLLSAAKWNETLRQTTPPIVNTFWTGKRWSFHAANAQPFPTKRKASEYLSVWIADMERDPT